MKRQKLSAGEIKPLPGPLTILYIKKMNHYQLLDTCLLQSFIYNNQRLINALTHTTGDEEEK